MKEEEKEGGRGRSWVCEEKQKGRRGKEKRRGGGGICGPGWQKMKKEIKKKRRG